ncbi:hypothetical protein Atai01_32870 [Amycolatopsis taiwanensis]|uniref:Uncharacterized protein n=1 Tax=Amycolatopsis taiwanensis TaxID=342230 RepID=A0A9W6VCY2_9PSEU|nr:hypothetical protein Atai01_32870 [Amycolatopsis taiwanensis]
MEVAGRKLPPVGDQEQILSGSGQGSAGAERPLEIVGTQLDAVEIGSEEPGCPGPYHDVSARVMVDSAIVGTDY